jgi:hypothetical protein
MAVDRGPAAVSTVEGVREGNAERGSMKRTRLLVIAVGTLLAASVGEALAQGVTYKGYATAFVGTDAGDDLPRATLAWGASVAVVDESGWGADLDFSFSDDDASSDPLDVLAFMVNFNWTKPTGNVKPYASGGLGVLRVNGCLSGCPQTFSATDFGLNVGGGAYITINDVVLLRGELKYLWAPGQHPDESRPNNYGFLRATFGVTLAWTVVD